MWSFFHRRNKAQAPQEDPRDSSEHKTAACHDYSPLHLDIRATGICINDKPLKTLNVSSLAEIFGPARLVSSTGASGDFERKGYESLAMWDEVGIFAFTVDGEDTTELGVRLAEDPVGEAAMYFDFASRRPSQLFPGSLTVEGRSPLSSIPQADLRTAYISLDTHAGEWTATFFLNATECGDLRTLNLVQRKAKAATDELTDYVRAAAHRFAWVSITYNAPRSDNRPSLERAPTGRWKHPVLTSTTSPQIKAINPLTLKTPGSNAFPQCSSGSGLFRFQRDLLKEWRRLFSMEVMKSIFNSSPSGTVKTVPSIWKVSVKAISLRSPSSRRCRILAASSACKHAQHSFVAESRSSDSKQVR